MKILNKYCVKTPWPTILSLINLFLIILFYSQKIFSMNFIEYEDKKEKITHLSKIKKLKREFELNELGIKKFSKVIAGNFELLENNGSINESIKIKDNFTHKIIYKTTSNSFCQSTLKQNHNSKKIGFTLEKTKNSNNSEFTLLNVETDKEIFKTEIFKNDNDNENDNDNGKINPFLLRYSNDKKHIALKINNITKLFDADNEKQVGPDFTNTLDSELCFIFSKNSKYLFLRLYDNKNYSAKLINADNGEQIGPEFINVEHENKYPFLCNDKYLLLRTDNDYKKLISTSSGQCILIAENIDILGPILAFTKKHNKLSNKTHKKILDKPLYNKITVFKLFGENDLNIQKTLLTKLIFNKKTSKINNFLDTLIKFK